MFDTLWVVVPERVHRHILYFFMSYEDTTDELNMHRAYYSQ